MSATTVEETQDLEAAIAEALSDLSQVDRAPRGVRITRPFGPDEVAWTSAAWIGALQEVQGWLRLPSELDVSSPQDFVSSLEVALAPPGVTAPALSASDHLSSDGLLRLRERCTRAVELQKQYLEDLEDDSSSGSAEQHWLVGWEDAEEDPDLLAAGPVSASAGTWSIIDFADRASTKKLNLSPSYQRGDVWPTPDAQILIESILRGIPLPSVIILKPQSSATGEFEVVDGKQRLTAILRFMGRHPRALEIVRDAASKYPDRQLETLFRDDYRKFRLAWKNAIGTPLTDRVERANYFPFKLRSGSDTGLQGPLSAFQGRYYSEIRENEVAISDTKVAVSEVFETSSDYKIPLIQYTKATPRQVHEVFKLYNKQGKQLNAEEIRNAMYHELSLMRGLLVAAGDSTDAETVAPFLHRPTAEAGQVKWVEDLGRALEGYGFGTTRYKRTKVLSWFASLLLHDSRQPGSKPARRSTAGQIDALLRGVEADPQHPLRKEQRLTDLFQFTASVVEVHGAVPDAWDARLQGGSSGKWQEMPLVGTLLGVAQAVLVLGDTKAIDALDDNAAEIADAARHNLFRRPKSIQTATQWGYISRLGVGIAELLGASSDEAHLENETRFQTSGIAALIEVAAMPETV